MVKDKKKMSVFHFFKNFLIARSATKISFVILSPFSYGHFYIGDK